MQQSQHRLHALVAVVLVATLASVSAFLHGGAEVERLLPDTSDGAGTYPAGARAKDASGPGLGSDRLDTPGRGLALSRLSFAGEVIFSGRREPR